MDNKSQRAYLRDLAGILHEIALAPETAKKRKRWCDVNALKKPDRAPVFSRPAGAWDELLSADSLRCTDSRLRNLEIAFRKMLIKNEIGDDSIVQPYVHVDAAFDIDPHNTYGVDIATHDSNLNGGAWAYAPALKKESDFDRLVFPKFTYNKAKTEEKADFIHELVGDILPPKIGAVPSEHATICMDACLLRGMTQVMYDAIESPELLHRLMAYVRDVTLLTMDQIHATGLLTPNTNDAMYMSDELDPQPGGAATYQNCFGVGNSQEFDTFSPAMWEEFLLDYQKPIYSRFGLAAYGCCENLTHKIDKILTIPNLRIFVCSAWTNLDKVIDLVGDKYAIMWRQKASDVCFAKDTASLKKDLENGCRQLKGSYFQIVLRELQTFNGNVKRLYDWTALAKDAAAKYI